MDETDTNADVRYERKDIRLRWLLALLAGGCCFLAIHYYVTWRFFWWRASEQEATSESPYPTEPAISTKLPPEPRLEQLDRLAKVESSDVSKRLAAQQKTLDSYGPTAKKGFVHIPIREAIKATAGKLPVRQPSPGQTAKASGLIDSGEPNSGRVFRGASP
jgi:hypothetical protein